MPGRRRSWASTGRVKVSSKPSGRACMVEHLEGDLAGPVEPLEGVGLGPARAPSAVGAADEERALGGEQERQVARGEPLSGRGSTPPGSARRPSRGITRMIGAGRLVAHEQLVLEGAELAAGGVAGDAAGGLAHLGIGEVDGRAGAARGSSGPRSPSGCRSPGRAGRGPSVFASSIPLVAGGIAEEHPGLEVLQAAGAVPGPLVLGVEHVARRVHARRPPASGSRCTSGSPPRRA